MRKKITITLFALLMVFTVYSQGPKSVWATQSTDGVKSTTTNMAMDNNGNTFITGYFQGDVKFGSTTLSSNGSNDVFIAKINNKGEFVWAKNAGGTGADIGYGIDVDNSGNVYITGSFTLAASFGSEQLLASNFSEIFVSKIDNNGNFIWSKKAGGSQDDAGRAIAVDANGNIFITGSFKLIALFGSQIQLNVQENTMGGANQYENIFLAKMDNSGEFLWAKQGGGDGHDFGNDIAVNAQGEIFVAGTASDDIFFEGNNVLFNPEGENNSFIAKFNSSGVCQWVGGVSSKSENNGYAVAADDDGNCYLAGRYSGSSIFTNTYETANGNYDAYIVKYDNNGTLIWYKLYGVSGNATINGLSVSKDKNVYMAGEFNQSINFDSKAYASKGGVDFFVAKLDNEGNDQWFYTAGSSKDDFTSKLACSNGNCYVTGSFNGNFSMDDNALSTATVQSIFVAKISEDGSNTDDDNDNNSVSDLNLKSINVYPNPASEIVVITNVPNYANVSITDIHGKEVKMVSNEIKSETIVLDIDEISDGFYYINIHTTNGVLTKKLIINR